METNKREKGKAEPPRKQSSFKNTTTCCRRNKKDSLKMCRRSHHYNRATTIVHDAINLFLPPFYNIELSVYDLDTISSRREERKKGRKREREREREAKQGEGKIKPWNVTKHWAWAQVRLEDSRDLLTTRA